MKVQCDVCETAQATILCCADEASLCVECDTRVHAANKLASKHQRLPLMYPSPEDLPCCDICQEKTGYFFCLEDRALLCRNCDYSIHSTNSLAANHKRFLVSGVRVGLQTITASEPSESIQACSPLQVSSPTRYVSQLSSPTTQVSQLSSPGNIRQQKSARLTPLPSSLDPQESSSLVIHEMREEALNKVSALPSARQEQQQSTTSIMNLIREEALNKVPSLSSAKHKQPQLQQSAVVSSQQKLRHITTTGVFPSKVVSPSSMTLSPSSMNQQMYLNGGRQLTDWCTCSDMKNNNAQDSNKVEVWNQRGAGGGSMRRNGISEYLTESIPGWRVDELLNLPDIDAIYNNADCGISKTDGATSDADWVAECSVSDSEGAAEAVAAEVPKMPSPPTASGFPRLTKPWGFGNSVKEPDLDFLLHCDDPLVVPDIGGVSSPTTLSPSSFPQKRKRTSFEF